MVISSGRARLPRPDERDICTHAEKFSAWVQELFDKTDLKDLIQIHQAILQLSKQYRRRYLHVPQKHQVRVGPNGHLCIFHVFIHALDALEEACDDIDPPLYFPPPPPPPPARIERVEVPVPMIPSFSDKGSLLGLSFGANDERVD